MVFNEESVLQERSETEVETQDGAPDSSIDTQVKRVEFSDSPKRLYGLNENSSDLDEDKQKATQEQLTSQSELQCHQ